MVAGWVFLFIVWLVASWKQQPRLARAAAWLGFSGTVLYVCLLYGFAWKSKEKTLARGVEKYFCELDCHLAYSVQGVEKLRSYSASGSAPAYQAWAITVRTRFDGQTVSPLRGNSPLTPNLRYVAIIGKDGRQIRVDEDMVVELRRPLSPGEAYNTRLVFGVPLDVKEPRLLIRTDAWESKLLIGSEDSPGHRKTYFALEP